MSGAGSTSVHEVARIEFKTAELMRLYPPQFLNGHKRMLFSRITAPVSGKLQVSRWRGDLPAVVNTGAGPELDMREDVFSYPPAEPGTTAWHLNFADAELFGYYGGPLLAQDEHQVLEHPVLGSLRDALLETGRTRTNLMPRTRDGEPTPFLIQGAQRCLSFDTVAGPYGKAFAVSPPDVILHATTYLDPPSLSNILAMEAPSGGRGRYRRDEIRETLRTAYIGFSACKLESAPNQAIVHTGNWGCGAYGGNPVLMAILQLLAARLASVDRLVFHTFSPRFSESYAQAVKLLRELSFGASIDVNAVIEELDSRAFEWGQSDGN